MTPDQPGEVRPRLSPLLRVSAFYFWLLTTTALATPYLAIWLSGRGISQEQIGLINAAPLLVVMAFNLIIGRAADLWFGWRRMLLWGTGLAVVTPVLLGAAQGFTWHLIAWVLVLAPVNLVTPLADAASARVARRLGQDFARVRLWGTIGHMAVTAAACVVVSFAGVGAFLPLLFFVGAMRFAAALALPEMQPKPRTPAAGPPPPSPGDMRRFRQGWFLLPVAASALISASHAMQNVLGAIYWQAAGLSALQIALLWAVAAGSEIGMMLCYRRLLGLISARTMLALAGGIAALRWGGLALEPGFWALMALQVLHMFSFGLSYLATVSFVVNWTDDAVGGRAQSLVSLIRQAGTAAAMVMFGWLGQRYGTGAYGGAALMAATATGLVLISLWKMPARRLGVSQ